jgi:hypothetical protein
MDAADVATAVDNGAAIVGIDAMTCIKETATTICKRYLVSQNF